ncbi:MAG TPA: serine hydrolase [Thermoanaerobaculia bacterium]
MLQRASVFLLLLALPLFAQQAELDAIAAKAFPADRPGAAVLVMKGGQPLLRKGYGLADVEQGTRIAPESVFRIGSLTKQFTAVAILQLVEGGKLALTDPITKFIPDYPTQGKTITIEHLLTHTSGIRSYTDKPDFPASMRKDLTPAELIATFRNDPMQFDPGAQWAYNNSAYILLGHIIEQLSGMPYADYLKKNVYPRAGLTSTYYDDVATIVPRRVPGYANNGGKLINAAYLAMSLPYAAGSLLSTVDDLAKWNAALAAGKVVDRRLLDKAWTPFRLTSGESSGYGYGWGMRQLSGERVIQHSGGINGYASFAMWMPERDVYVAVLSNHESPQPSPSFVAGQLALQAIGKTWAANPIALPASALAEYTGVYRVSENVTRTITVENGQLHSQRTGNPALALVPVGKDEFVFRDSFTALTFERDAAGKIVAMISDDGRTKSRAPLTNEKPVTRTEITIDPAKLDRYAGDYQLAPTFFLKVFRKGDELWTQATGQGEIRIYPESESKWFLKVVDAQLTFEFDEKGVAKALTLHQNGRNMPAPRVP